MVSCNERPQMFLIIYLLYNVPKERRTMMKEWCKNVHDSLFLERVETSVSVRKRQWEGDADTNWPMTAILNHIFFITLILFSGPHLALLLLLDRGPTAPSRGWRPTRLLPWFGYDSNWLTATVRDCLWPTVIDDDSGFLWIYNFVTPTRSSGSWFTWSCSTCQPSWAVFQHIHLEHPVPEIPNLRLCQRWIYNILRAMKDP